MPRIKQVLELVRRRYAPAAKDAPRLAVKKDPPRNGHKYPQRAGESRSVAITRAVFPNKK